MNGDGQESTGSERLDRIERALELLVDDHVIFREEHKHLLSAQVLLTGSIEKLSSRMEELAGRVATLAEKVETSVEKVGTLAEKVETLAGKQEGLAQKQDSFDEKMEILADDLQKLTTSVALMQANFDARLRGLEA